jgi:hypothetical protein
MASGQANWAPTAAVYLGHLLKEQGRAQEAEAAYRQAMDSGHAVWGLRAADALARLQTGA